MTRPGMRDTVTVIIWFNLGDADLSIVPSVSRALCWAICFRLLLGRVWHIRFLASAGLPALASHFPSTGLVLILSTPEG